tara:strand:- start:653 stop:880 length:228 start_codon:yes stop_codon:yes gene_type:complete
VTPYLKWRNKMDKDKKIITLIEKNESLLKELGEMEVELYEYRQIFDSIVKKFGNDVVKIFTERDTNAIKDKELPN